MKIMIMNPSHWPDVKRIYQEGINTGNATFEEAPPDTWQDWNNKFIANLSLVWMDDRGVRGWAAVSPISTRPVYRGVGEVSVYVDEDFRGLGIGLTLMQELVSISEEGGIWTLQASIFPENIPSVQAHQAAGFRVVGERQKIGRMTIGPDAGNWRDVLLMERRSECFRS